MACYKNIFLFVKKDEYTQEKQEIEISSKTHFSLLTINGLDIIENDFQTSISPYQDGVKVINRKIGARLINLDLEILCEDKRYFLKFFKNSAEGKFYIKNVNNTVFIDYLVKSCKIVQENLCKNPILLLSLLCPYPYFKDVDDLGENILERVKLWSVPLVQLKNKDIVTDYKKFNSYLAFSNDGDVEIGVIITITSNDRVVSPKIILDDNEFIEIDITVNINDVLEINTNKKNKYIKFNNQNILQKINVNSTFFQLSVGKHKIGYDAEEGKQFLNIYISRRHEYVAVY